MVDSLDNFVMSKNASRLCPPDSPLLSWNSFWITMNWSSLPVSHEEWKYSVLDSSLTNSNYLENAIEFSNARNFIHWLGPRAFCEHWPRIRGYCPMRLFHQRRRFDLLWSVFATPSPCVVPSLPVWYELTPLERKMLVYVSTYPGMTLARLNEKSGLGMDVVTATINRLVAAKCLEFGGESIYRCEYFRTFQYKRPITKRRFRIHGKVRVFENSPDW